MKRILLPILFAFLAAQAGPLFADRIVLKQGKTLHGTITHEDKDGYEIKLGAGMFLRVRKDEVSQVYRKKRKEQKATVVTLESIEKEQQKKEEEEKARKAAEESAENKDEMKKEENQPVAPAAEATVQVVKEGRVNRATQANGLTLYDTVETKTYPVDGKTRDEVYDAIFDLTEGKGFKLEGRRNASKVEFKADWEGQIQGGSWGEVIVRTTMTVVEPAWTRKNPPKEEIFKWNEFFAKVRENDDGQTEIILKTLTSFANRARLLKENDAAALEKRTDELFAEALDQIEKRLRGFRRRHRIEK